MSGTLVVSLFSDGDREAWDAFIRESKNGTFLFERNYLEYHRDQFQDVSLIAREESGRLIAGTVIYESEQVARTQYIAVSQAGRAAGAGDLLFDRLLYEVYLEKPYMDFGGSNEREGWC